MEKSKKDPILAQNEIENNWMNLMFEGLSNENNLINTKKNYILRTVVKEAMKTMKIPKMKTKLIKKFGEIGHNLIEFAEIYFYFTLAIMIRQYRNSSHTHISYLVGSNIFNKYYLDNLKKEDSKKDPH